MDHIVMEGRNELIVGTAVSEARISREWTEAIALLAERAVPPGQTAGAEGGYDVRIFAEPCWELGFLLVATRKYCRPDGSRTHHPGYEISQLKAKAGRAAFWLNEAFWLVAQTSAPRPRQCRLAIPLNRNGLKYWSNKGTRDIANNGQECNRARHGNSYTAVNIYPPEP